MDKPYEYVNLRDFILKSKKYSLVVNILNEKDEVKDTICYNGEPEKLERFRETYVFNPEFGLDGFKNEVLTVHLDLADTLRPLISNLSAFGIIIGYKCPYCFKSFGDEADVCPHCHKPVGKPPVGFEPTWD